jgi:hypothetical protein
VVNSPDWLVRVALSLVNCVTGKEAMATARLITLAKSEEKVLVPLKSALVPLVVPIKYSRAGIGHIVLSGPKL